MSARKRKRPDPEPVYPRKGQLPDGVHTAAPSPPPATIKPRGIDELTLADQEVLLYRQPVVLTPTEEAALEIDVLPVNLPELRAAREAVTRENPNSRILKGLDFAIMRCEAYWQGFAAGRAAGPEPPAPDDLGEKTDSTLDNTLIRFTPPPETQEFLALTLQSVSKNHYLMSRAFPPMSRDDKNRDAWFEALELRVDQLAKDPGVGAIRILVTFDLLDEGAKAALQTAVTRARLWTPPKGKLDA